MVLLRVLGWNLYHGRDFPPDAGLLTWRSRLLRTTEHGATHAQVNRSLRGEFERLLADRFEWDVALLQEAPPRWFAPLARATRASGALALTSRNVMPALQRPLADWNPDLVASWEGGSNQTLVRGGRLLDVRRLTLTRRPERRRMLWLRVRFDDGRELCVANLHASASRRDAATREVVHAAERAVEWSGDAPLVFGGDFNLRPREQPAPFAALRDQLGLQRPTAPGAIDHLLTRGLEIVEAPHALSAAAREIVGSENVRVRLSDHAAVTATFGMA
jgi:endonuclease/exonuclease/phosphatase family metal-dependent hydrolase